MSEKPAEYLIERRRVSAWLSPTDYAHALRTARDLSIALPARCPRSPDRGTGPVSRQLRTALRRAALLRAAIMLRRHLCGTHRARIVAYYD